MYALLLLFIAVAMCAYSISLSILAIKIMLFSVSFLLFIGSIIIFSKYTKKIEKIEKAIKYYEKKGLDVEYLKYFLIDPCSILVLKYILFQINETKSFKRIKEKAVNFYISEKVKI